MHIECLQDTERTTLNNQFFFWLKTHSLVHTLSTGLCALFRASNTTGDGCNDTIYGNMSQVELY